MFCERVLGVVETWTWLETWYPQTVSISLTFARIRILTHFSCSFFIGTRSTMSETLLFIHTRPSCISAAFPPSCIWAMSHGFLRLDDFCF